MARSLLSAVNGSAWEQWYFDVVSSKADESLMMCVSRDASYTMMGQGVLRIEFFVMLANGTILGGPEFVDQSRVEDCCGHVRGVWKGPDRSYAFTISRDLSHIEGNFERPGIRGRFVLDAITPGRYADGSTWPSTTANHEVSPMLRIAEPMSAGRAKLELILDGEEPRVIQGLGGHNRFWSSKDWFSLVSKWNVGRATVGPYHISIWEDVSKLDGKKYQGSMLFKNGEPLVRASGVLLPSTSESTPQADHLLMSRRYGGDVHSNWGDMSTGWTLDFVSPSRGQRWTFELEHKTRPFEVGLGENRGLAGYTEVVSGGEVGGEQFDTGYGWTELVDLPNTFSLKLMIGVWWQMASSGDLLSFMWKMVSAPFRSG
ncbi:hypothetical protein BN1723_014914 [Verticillium longisporum]|uniref:AttH domain-containing protein n=2 Tax=Verticillium longisporum TaxID=100787 RepID=A0A0G4M9K0_VERLO|nr:hypothetical protein BN1708_015867 [Verticillium longisporum]CRK34807.1 hypothetical protein BN1723_014914 [Verticillium longisporum]